MYLPCPICAEGRITTSTTDIKIESIPTKSGESMEDVLDRNHNLNLGLLSITTEQIKAAMSEWASIQCAVKDKRIDFLGDKVEMSFNALESEIEICKGFRELLSTKEAAIKELVEGLERMANEYKITVEEYESQTTKVSFKKLLSVGLENYENSLQLITKHKPTTP